MKPFALVALAALATCAIGLSACGGDDDDKSPAAATAAATTKPAEGGNQPPAAATTAAAATAPPTTAPAATAGTAGVTGSGADALRSLTKDSGTKTYKGDYAMTIVQSGKTTSGTMTIARKPPKTYTNFQTTVDGNAGSFLAIYDGTNTITCIKAGPLGNQCFRSKSSTVGTELGAGVDIDEILKDVDESVDATEISSQTIAGQESRCFSLKRKSGDGTACFTKADGILTLVETKDTDGTTTLKATSVSKTVEDSLFAPPAGANIIDR